MSKKNGHAVAHPEEYVKYQADYHAKHRERLRPIKNKASKTRVFKEYGITREDALNMLTSQGNKCDICLEPFELNECRRTWNVDHNHATNEIRALLCTRCNLVLGRVCENVTLLESMISYIKKFNKIV